MLTFRFFCIISSCEGISKFPFYFLSGLSIISYPNLLLPVAGAPHFSINGGGLNALCIGLGFPQSFYCNI